MGVVAAHFFQVIVFARDAHALLRVRGAGVRAQVGAEKDVFELYHAGVGEQQGRVFAGHQRG